MTRPGTLDDGESSGLRLTDFLEQLRALQYAPSTILAYQRDLRRFAAWYRESCGRPASAPSISALDLREWSAFLARQPQRPATANRRLAAVWAYFRWAWRAGLVVSDPSRDLRFRKEVQLAPGWLSPTEVRALLRHARSRIELADLRRPPKIVSATACEARRDYAIIVLLLSTGLRLGELCALSLEDVRLDPASGRVIVRRGKGGVSRAVPLNREARSALRQWLSVRSPVTKLAFFLGRYGRPLGPRGVQVMLQGVARKAGIDRRVGPHALRHTLAKTLLDAGQPLPRIQALLGHAQLASTARYVLPSEQELTVAVEEVPWNRAPGP